MYDDKNRKGGRMAVKVRNVYKKGKGVAIGKRLKRDWQIYMFLLPTLLYFLFSVIFLWLEFR
ncbi:hypothetical protein [Eisenbergiella tayi]|uniref:hypothetical protein n=1 Tax=Eisenbergiella tayi TaxID=1432052 RepID=UPI00209451EE|nr:hypothetical protein [Eisenbergiella tayi]